MIACILMTYMRMKAERERRNDLVNHPVVIVSHTSEGPPKILERSPEAQHGILMGMGLVEARSRRHDLIIVESDEPYYQGIQNQIISRLLTKFDRVENADLGVIYVDLTGFGSTYGSEDDLHALLLGLIPSYFNPRIGIGSGKFPAYIASRHSESNSITKVSADVKTWLDGFPVDYLPVQDAIITRLRGFGLHTLGQVASLNTWELQSQFGLAGRRVWELCSGIDSDALIPVKPKQSVSRELELPFPTASIELIIQALELLITRAFSDSDLKGRFAQKAVISGRLLHGDTWEKSFVFKTPVSDSKYAMPPLQHFIEGNSLPNLLTDLKLTFLDFQREPQIQLQLPGLAEQVAPLSEVVNQLRVRLGGKEPLVQLMDVEPNHCLPERHHVWIPTLEPVNAPVPVIVQTDRNQRPTYMQVKRRAVRVAQVENLWKVTDYWSSAKPANRRYFDLVLQNGSREIVFMDLDSGEWFKQSYTL